MAAGLQRDYEARRRGTTNSYAAAGQLYSGATTNARNIDRRGYEQNFDTAQRNYQDTLAGIAQKQLEAQRVRDEGIAAAQAGSVADAIEERPDPSVVAPPAAGRDRQQKPNKDKDRDKKKRGR